MTQPMLRTKTLIPPVRVNRINRPQLIHRIDDATHGALTILEAPAGFGKTTLAASWAEQSQMPVAWLTLQESDIAVERFLTYLVQALQVIFPKVGQTTLTLIHANPIENAVYSLINDLSEINHRHILILDDYQNIDTQENAKILQLLLENRPPNFHLLIASRSTPQIPLTRLRAKAQVCEISGNELRFNSSEIRSFLVDCMGVSLSDLEITKLGKSTEGWPVALQLATLAYTRNTQEWSLPASQDHIFDYLAEEVLEKESPHIQRFLLQTALFDRFCLPLYQVLNPDESTTANPGDILATIDRSNLFLIPLDHTHTWYRYHALFAEFLRKQVSADEAALLFMRASCWFEENDLLDEAIHYAIHGGNIHHAANLLEENYRISLARGDHTSMFEWIDAMPPEILNHRPRLWFAKGWACMISLSAMEAIHCAEFAENMIPEGEEGNLLRSEAKAIKILANIFLGNIQGLNQHSESFIWLSEQDEFLHHVLHLNIGLYSVLAGETANALDAFSQTLEMDSIQNIPLIYILAYVQTGEVRQIRGAFGLAERAFQQAIQFGKDTFGSHSVLLGMPYMSYADLLREQNRFEEALTYVNSGIQLSYLWEPLSSMDGQITLARIMASTGKWEKAFQKLEYMMSLIPSENIIINKLFVSIHMARLYLLHGNFLEAQQIIEKYNLQSQPPEIYFLKETCLLMLLRAEILNPDQDIHQFMRINQQLEIFIQDTQLLERISPQIEAFILQAYAWHKMEKHQQAIQSLSTALTLGSQSGYVRIFADEGSLLHHLLVQYHDKLSTPMTYLDRIQEILRVELAQSMSRKETDKPSDELLIPLTRRELDILEAMAAGDSNQEIAEKLILSVYTVKKHVANILSKINVSNRTQAVMMAKKMAWIKPM